MHGGSSNGSALELTRTNAYITNCSFSFNTVGNMYHLYFPQMYCVRRVGGAVIVNSSNVVISSSHFDSNTAELGGALFSDFDRDITISNCTLVNNAATGCSYNTSDLCSGGALYIGSRCTVAVYNSSFMNNTSEADGGAIALFDSGTYIGTQNIFVYNEASNFGGAIFTHHSNGVTVSNSYYNSNTAGRKGGVMYGSGNESITMDNSSFNSNRAGEDGGVVYANFYTEIAIDHSSYTDNEANNNGGVIYLHVHDSTDTMHCMHMS